MEKTVSSIKEEKIVSYCKKKGYRFKKSPQQGGTKIEIADLKDKITLNLYESGALVVGPKPGSRLKNEFDSLKKEIEESSSSLDESKSLQISACAQKYTILLSDTKTKIRGVLTEIDPITHYIDDPTPSEEYRAKLTIGKDSLSITQYKNGTLFLQGKANSLFDKTCDLIEKTAMPSETEVACRFISTNEEALAKFTACSTPKLLLDAEDEMRKSLSNDVFDFLEEHDRRWLVATGCLKIANIPLPEYSPIVMPASKAFEGFIKKLLIKVGFYPPNHFDDKNSTFSPLTDMRNPTREAFINKDKYADTYLKKINVCLDTNRNFMMHSDDSTLTKVESYEDAIKKVTDICRDISDIYHYFKTNPVFGL